MEVKSKLKIFGNNVKQNRIKHNMTIKELADSTGITEKYIIKIENGEACKMSCLYIFKLANAFNIEPSELCDGI